MSMHLRLSGLLLAGVFAGPANATFTQNSSGLANPNQTITFETVVLTANQPVTTQFASFGVSFSTAYANPDPSTAYPHISGNRIGNFMAGVPVSGLFTINFATPISAAAFAIVTATGPTTFTALLHGNLVQTASATTSNNDTNNYFAFSGIAFNQITVFQPNVNGALMIDNLQTAVPEPASATLLLVGVAALLWRRMAPRTA